MKPTFRFALAISALFTGPLLAQEGEDVFEYNVDEFNPITGENFEVLGIFSPEVYVIGTGGLFEPGASAEDFATSEHDPLNDIGIQAVEIDIAIEYEDVVTGLIAATGFMGEGEEWEVEFEEAFIHYHFNDFLSIGGGQYLTAFGFQNTQHLHGWDFVNQNLVNSRILSEGELTSQGGEILFRTPRNSGLLTLGFGGIRSHAHGHGEEGHGHGHDEEEEHGEEEGEHHDEEEEHHFDLDEANLNNSIVSADYRFRLPFDETITLSTSVAGGENGYGLDTFLYGVGVQKVWNGHDHGNGPEFCTGAVMLRSEFIGRDVEAIDEEDGDDISFDDHGISTGLHYGISDRATISLRHDWVSEIELAEVSDSHRFSAALSAFVDPSQRVRARVQYDHTQNDDIGSEHAAYLQFQVQWGGIGGSHAGHNH